MKNALINRLAKDLLGSQIENKQRLFHLKARRKYWLTIHLWMGLSLGFLLSLYGLTGSILVFNSEIDELLNPNLLTVNIPQRDSTYQPLAVIFAAGNDCMPAQAKATFATYPRNNQASFQLNYAIENHERVREEWQVAIDPYTAKVLGKRMLNSSDSVFPKTLIGFIFALHYSLFLGENISAVVVGSSAALLIISILTGLILWWPLTGKWWTALSFKPKASRERFNYDLHKLSGFYTSWVMLPVLFSGIYMVLPEQVVPVLEIFSPVTYRYWFESSPPHINTSPIGMAAAVAIAKEIYPTGHPDWIYGAPEAKNTYTVCLDDVDSPGSLLKRRCVVIDRYSGKLLDLDDPVIGSSGEVFTQWQWPLHSGKAFGMFGRILVFISGLACPVLFITGILHWVRKRKVAKQRSSKQNICNRKSIL